ncbi:MAG TPA: hypothetical protein VFK80_07855, partial [Limnochordia bacterium]|nr:hypothetical protein [Limnochordia bacterium]
MSIDDIKTVWSALQRLPADLATLDHVSTAITAAVTVYNQRGGSPGALFADFLKRPADSAELKLYGTTDHFTWSTPAYWETDDGSSSGSGSGNSGGSSGDTSGESPKPEVVHQVHASGRITATSPVGGVTNGSWSMEYDALRQTGSVSVSGTINGQSGGYSFTSCGGGSASTGSVSFAVCGTMTFGKTMVDISGYASASAGGGFSLHIDGRAGSQTASASVSGETKVFMTR